MTTDLAPIPPPALPVRPVPCVVAAFLAGRNPRTLRAYARDLADFAHFFSRPTAAAAVEDLLLMSQGDANAAALGYRAHLVDRQLAPATTARRLAALRSVVKVARLLGRVAWTLDVESPRAERYRDTAGPGQLGWFKLWTALEAAGDDPRARRDRAILQLLYARGLRRGEAVGLDLADVDLEADPPAVAILGKGRTQRERLTINGGTRRALGAWIEARGSEPGPLFVRLDTGRVVASRLSGESVRLMVRDRAAAAGIKAPVRPHGLRHAGITALLDMTNGDMRSVAQFSRHRDIRTLAIYDDRRADVGGEMTRRLDTD